MWNSATAQWTSRYQLIDRWLVSDPRAQPGWLTFTLCYNHNPRACHLMTQAGRHKGCSVTSAHPPGPTLIQEQSEELKRIKWAVAHVKNDVKVANFVNMAMKEYISWSEATWDQIVSLDLMKTYLVRLHGVIQSLLEMQGQQRISQVRTIQIRFQCLVPLTVKCVICPSFPISL